MKALLRKELVQILPAQVFVALVQAVILTWSIPPRALLLPSRIDMAEAYWVWSWVAILEGTLVGMLQFGRERSARTEAYLVHRGTGGTRAFTAKAIAAALALGVLVLLPPLAYGIWHVAWFPSVEHPLTERLGYFVAVGACSLPAYAIGALCAQIRKRWGIRSLLGLLGMLTLSFVCTISSFAFAGADRTPVAPFVVLQFVIAVVTLALAHALFKAGEDRQRPWPGRPAVVAAVAAILMTWIPWIGFVATSQQVARSSLFTTYPQIVEGERRTLYTVQRIKRRDAHDSSVVFHENEFRDARGNLVQVDRGDEYDRIAFDLDPFLTLFDPSTSWLHRTTPNSTIEPPFWQRVGVYGFEGAWSRLNIGNQYPWDSWLRVSEGTVYLVGKEYSVREQTATTLLHRPDTGQPFSDRTLIATGFDRFTAMLLIDRSDLTLWQATGQEPTLDPVALPNGDRLLGLERLHPWHSVRAGLFDQPGGIEDFLFLGETGRYVWSDGHLQPFLDAAPNSIRRGPARQSVSSASDGYVSPGEIADAIVWRMEPTRIDGLGFRLEVFDAQSGELALAHDYLPESTEQKGWAALAWLMSPARSPAGALWSHFAADVEPRNATRLLSYSSVRDPLLLGGARPGLLAACLAVGVVLAALAHRRIGRNPRDRAVRRTWTLAILLLGLPAWILFRLLEPSRKVMLARSQASEPRAQLLIESPRSTSVLEPALSAV